MDAFDEAAGEWKEHQRDFAKFVARYWADERFRESVRADPAKALKSLGLSVEKGRRVKLVELDPDEQIFVVPSTERDWSTQAASGIDLTHCAYCFGSFFCAGTWGGATFGTVGSVATAGCFEIPTACSSDPDDPDEPDDDEPEEPDDSGDSGDTGDAGGAIRR